MTYETRQQHVMEIRQQLKTEWNGSAQELASYFADQPEELRRDLYAMIWKLGTGQLEPNRKQAIVQYMVGKLTEETPEIRDQLLGWIQDFIAEDHNDESRKVIDSLPWDEHYAPQVIRLVGICNLESAKSRLQDASSNSISSEDSGWHQRNGWNARLAKIRMGDDSDLDEVIRRVRSETDLIVRATILFDDLGYTKHPRAFDALKEYLNSENRLPELKSTVPGRREACYAGEQFAKHVAGYPDSLIDVSESNLDSVREWVNAQPEWKLK